MNVHAALLGLRLKLGVQFLHVLAGIVLHVGDGMNQGMLINVLEDTLAVFTVGDGKGVKRLAEELILQGALNFLMVFGVIFGSVMHIRPPAEQCAVPEDRAHRLRKRAQYRQYGSDR